MSGPFSRWDKVKPFFFHSGEKQKYVCSLGLMVLFYLASRGVYSSRKSKLFPSVIRRLTNSSPTSKYQVPPNWPINHPFKAILLHKGKESLLPPLHAWLSFPANPSRATWGRSQDFFPWNIKLRGRIPSFLSPLPLNAQLSFLTDPSLRWEGAKLSSPEMQSYEEGFKLSSPSHAWLSSSTNPSPYGKVYSQAFFLPKCTAILPHMGKESSFPLNKQLSLPTNPSPHGKGFKLSSL